MNYLKFLIIALPFIATLSLPSCSSDDVSGDDSGTPRKYSLSGHVEKGPFVQGSSISVQPLNSSLTAVGTIFNGEISDDKGSFDIGTIELSSPYARITADGYFFNEVQGSLSSGTIKLNAIVDLSNTSTVNVNLLTHLKAARVQRLVRDGKSFSEANSQAQEELLTQFGLQRFANTDFSKVTISDGSDAAAALIVISSLVISNRSEAELTEYISTISAQLSNNGKFSDNVIREMSNDRDYLRGKLEDIPSNIINRYQSLGQTVTVKSLVTFCDWDGDGVAGNEISDNPQISLSQESVHFPKDGGDVTITVTSNISLSLSDGSSDNPIVDSYYQEIFDNENLSLENIYGNGKLTIRGGANKCSVSRSRDVALYDVLGNKVVTIPVTWDADTDYKPTLTAVGSSYMNKITQDMLSAVSLDRYLTLAYCGINTGYNFTAPLSASNSDLGNLWKYDYTAIISICTVVSRLTNTLYESYANILSTYLAVIYAPMMDEWGNLPFRTPDDYSTYQLSRTSKEAIQSYLIGYLQKAVEACPSGKYESNYQPIDIIEITKDIPYLALADLYMQKGEYADAFTYLNKVAGSGHYSFVNSLMFNTSNKEIIFGLVDSSDATKVQPVYMLSDVYLKMAECKYRIGDESTAQTYVNKVVSAHDALTATSGTVIEQISAIRKQTRLPQYFAFLKRNNLAATELGLKDYQLLWAIPRDEMMYNTACEQNAGY
jgi:hypothetical protein